MAIKENQSNSELYMVALNLVTSSPINVPSNGFDTTDFDNGVTFIPWWTQASGPGIYELSISAVQDSDDNITFDTLPADQVVTSDLSFFDDIPQILPTPIPGLIHTIGVVGTRRYVRVLYSVILGGGDAMLVTILAKGGLEIKPGNS